MNERLGIWGVRGRIRKRIFKKINTLSRGTEVNVEYRKLRYRKDKRALYA